MRDKFIFDSCVLSNFALSDTLYVIKELYSRNALITNYVYMEIMKGIHRKYTKLLSIKNALISGWLEETTFKSFEEKDIFENISVSLGFGEASCISVAKTRCLVFACDDRAARKTAQSFGIRLTGTIGILVKAMKTGAMNNSQANQALKMMINQGFYSPISSLNEIEPQSDY